MRLLTAILALLTGVAGWFYLFYSAAARRLGAIERHGANRWRVLLRRTNGLFMIVLAALLYSGTNAIDEHAHPKLFVLDWLGVILLLAMLMLLVLVDVFLTLRLRGQLRERRLPNSRDEGPKEDKPC